MLPLWYHKPMITIIQTTSDKRAELEKFATELVEQHLAACAQIEGPIGSTNVWEGKVQSTEEFKLTLKTTSKKVEPVATYLKQHHSYDLPEIIWHEVHTSDEYQNWVEQEVAGDTPR